VHVLEEKVDIERVSYYVTACKVIIWIQQLIVKECLLHN